MKEEGITKTLKEIPLKITKMISTLWPVPMINIDKEGEL
jgi:hypothetical protein